MVVGIYGQESIDKNKYKHTASNLAYSIGQVRIDEVKTMLKEGADVNGKVPHPSQDKLILVTGDGELDFGRTPLMVAARKGLTEIAKLLIDAGANVNDTDDHGLTALMHAARKGQAQTLELLLINKADTAKRDNDGMTALLWASPYIPVLEALLQSGADINAKNNDGETALMRTFNKLELKSSNDRIKRVGFLIDHGVDVNARNLKGQTILSIIKTFNDSESKDEMINLLLRVGALE